MAAYYEEARPTSTQMRQGDDTSRAARLLRDYFWRGQRYGDSTKPKSLFMRPFCEFIVPSRLWQRQNQPLESENIVLYVSAQPTVWKVEQTEVDILGAIPSLGNF
jgi:hypothetical protein